MPRLLSDPASAIGQAVYLLRQVRTTIGRRSFNDIVINHRSVSGEHALIRREGQDIYLEDLHSTNGTFVNGRFIKRQRLEHNDTVEIGGCVLRYMAEEAADNPTWTPKRVPPLSTPRRPRRGPRWLRCRRRPRCTCSAGFRAWRGGGACDHGVLLRRPMRHAWRASRQERRDSAGMGVRRG